MFESFEKYSWLWLMLLCAVNFMFMLGGHSLWDVDEPNNAVCAREMLETGNWWVPVFNGDLRFDKPILLYWLMMPAFSLFGVNEFAARLPSALGMTALTFVVFAFGKRLVDHRTGLIAAALFASSLHIIVISRAATPDPLFMLCICLGLLAMIKYYMEGFADCRLLYLAYTAFGFGVLAKGPVAVVMPALVLGAFVTLMGQWRHAMRFHPMLGLFIILAIALPWYISVGVLTDGRWLEGFLLHHNLDRFTDTLQGHKGFPGLYLLTLLLGWVPWSGLLLAALCFGAWRLTSLRRDPLRLFLLCWIGTFVIFFSIARTQLPNYMLPVFPAAALLMALWLRDADAGKARRWTLRGALTMAILLMLGGGIALEKQWQGEWIYALSFAPLVPVVFLALWRKRDNAIPVISIGMAVCVLMLAGWVLPALDRHKVTPELAKAADAAGFNGSELASYRYFQPSLLFYHGGRLPLLKGSAEAEAWLARGKAVVMPEEAVDRLPSAMIPKLRVHARHFGLYARRWLVLVSLKPEENVP